MDLTKNPGPIIVIIIGLFFGGGLGVIGGPKKMSAGIIVGSALLAGLMTMQAPAITDAEKANASE